MLVSDVKDGIDEKMEEAKEDAKDVADEKEKRHGKRKSAAKDLNISERTLYRKIKEYGLD